MKVPRRQLPALTEELRLGLCARILDALLALDEGRSDETDTHLRWMEVLCLLWGSDAHTEPLIPELNRLRASQGLEPVSY